MPKNLQNHPTIICILSGKNLDAAAAASSSLLLLLLLLLLYKLYRYTEYIERTRQAICKSPSMYVVGTYIWLTSSKLFSFSDHSMRFLPLLYHFEHCLAAAAARLVRLFVV